MSDDKNPHGQTTGHVWDETLAELTNEPPKWWMWGLHASWIIVVLYTIYYPSWPLVTSHFKGLAGWTSIGEYKKDLATLDTVRAKYEDKLPGMTAAAILADDELSNYVVRSAKVLFGDNCAACHGTGGAGNPGYPVLVDDDWLWGGTIETIEQTVTMGRNGMMPKMGGAQLTDAEIDSLANAIHSGKVAEEPLFKNKACFGCHGADGKGNPMLGAPNLNDAIWRFRSKDQLASIKHTITHGVNDPTDKEARNAVMPRFGGTKLSETDIKKLTVYVHKLGGGQ